MNGLGIAMGLADGLLILIYLTLLAIYHKIGK